MCVIVLVMGSFSWRLQWLAETVVVPVAKEIDAINQVLSKGATPGVEVGGQLLLILPLLCACSASAFTAPLPPSLSPSSC